MQEDYENIGEELPPKPPYTYNFDSETDTSEDEVEVNYAHVNIKPKSGHQRDSSSSSSSEDETQYSQVKIWLKMLWSYSDISASLCHGRSEIYCQANYTEQGLYYLIVSFFLPGI